MNERVLKAILITLPLIVSLLLGIYVIPARALLNPAAVYCHSLGYTYTVESTPEGERGLCQLPNGEAVDAWEFLQGKVASEYSYCHSIGCEIRTVSDREECIRFNTEECAVCVLKDGTEVEVTELMGLSFEETVCGDGNCGFPENFDRCPQDCPSGGSDAYCDGVRDGIVDPDCRQGDDPDYAVTTPTPMVTATPTPTPKPTPTPMPPPLVEEEETNIWVIIGPVLGVLLAGAVIYYLVARRGRTSATP